MLCRQVNDHVDIFLNWAIKFLFEWQGKSSPINSTHYTKLYPQNGDRILIIDSMTSFHPVYCYKGDTTWSACVRLLTTAEAIERPLRGRLPDEYDGIICAVVAMRAVDAIIVATCRTFCSKYSKWLSNVAINGRRRRISRKAERQNWTCDVFDDK